MTDALTIFKSGNPLANSDLFRQLAEFNKALTGNTFGGKRISIRGGKFRLMDNGQQVAVNKTGKLELVIVNAAKVSRTFFEGSYDPDNPAPPTCWSLDTTAPAPEVPADQRQATRCIDCAQNVKGSGANDSRACRFGQRIAVVFLDKPSEVYQMQIPATSIFGEPVNGQMGMQAYAKFLSAHSMPAIAVVTEVSFDDDSDVPRLFFKPVRVLTEEELTAVVEVKDSPDAVAAITLTVSQTDKVEKKAAEPKAEAKPKAAVKKPAPQVDDDEEDDVPPPKKREEAKPAVAAKKADIKALVSQWDEDDE